jgi:ribosomal protein S12 methylthiotransferase accessory factor
MEKMKTLNQLLMEKACNFRCGITLPFQKVPNKFCDIDGVYNYAVPDDTAQRWQTASGGFSDDENAAIMAAIGESLERYCGAVCEFELKKYSELGSGNIVPFSEFALFSDEQYANPDFAWQKPNINKTYFGNVYSIYDNSEYYIPQELIGLGSRKEEPLMPSTSTGIAAHTNKYSAILSAVCEVLERDALVTYWLNSLGGREIPLDNEYTEEVRRKGGEVFCFDLTQDWNPFPVIAVCGHLLSRNKKRISLGAACRADYKSAIKKAYHEWIQGCIFAGYFDDFHPDLLLNENSSVNSFDIHAVYYTKKPHEWHETPLLKHRKPYKPKAESSNQTLEFLLKSLKRENIRFYYKDITTADVRETGLTVVRVVSPNLSLLHGDENMLFLGGRTGDVCWRYKNLEQGEFPNKYPHPLG